MCMNTPNVPDPKMATQSPTEYAAAKMPDQGQAAGAGNAMRDRMRAGAGTILTSGSGVTSQASTAKKTLLGA